MKGYRNILDYEEQEDWIKKNWAFQFSGSDCDSSFPDRHICVAYQCCHTTVTEESTAMSGLPATLISSLLLSDEAAFFGSSQ
jgi:hypothetical protein